MTQLSGEVAFEGCGAILDERTVESPGTVPLANPSERLALLSRPRIAFPVRGFPVRSVNYCSSPRITFAVRPLLLRSVNFFCRPRITSPVREFLVLCSVVVRQPAAGSNNSPQVTPARRLERRRHFGKWARRGNTGEEKAVSSSDMTVTSPNWLRKQYFWRRYGTVIATSLGHDGVPEALPADARVGGEAAVPPG